MQATASDDVFVLDHETDGRSMVANGPASLTDLECVVSSWAGRGGAKSGAGEAAVECVAAVLE